MLGRVVAAVVLTVALVGGVAESALTTLHSQNRGPQVSSAADLQDAGSIQRLGVALSSTGGTVVRILPDGVIVQPNRVRGTLQRIIFLRGATILQRNVPTTAGAIELGAHVSVIGQAGVNPSAPFAATKIRISPHRHAIGGIILYISSDGHLTLQNTRLHTVYLVKVLTTTPISTVSVSTSPSPTISSASSKGTHGPWRVLRLGQHVQVLAVHNPDPQQQDTYLADAIRVVRRNVSVRIGGLIRRVDPRSNIITLYARQQNQTYSIAVLSSTVTSLSHWRAGYADMFPGDHLTVSGYVDTAAITGTNGLSGYMTARRIRISSPSFAGVIVGLSVRSDGSVVLDVRRKGHGSHLLRVVATSHATTVVYATNPARVLDLALGERISAHGARTDKFALLASSIHVYPRIHTVGGTVTSIIPGAYRIVSATSGRQYVVRTTSFTVYTTSQGQRESGHPGITVGMRLRAGGYDALHNDQRRIPRLIATHITILAQHHSRRRNPKPTLRATSPVPTATPARSTRALTSAKRGATHARAHPAAS